MDLALQPDRLVPVTGLIKQIADREADTEQGEIAKAYALCNYVFHTMRYDKSGVGWGRDLTLNPKQQGPPVNFFVYPYVEIDGHPFTSVTKEFRFRDVGEEAEQTD